MDSELAPEPSSLHVGHGCPNCFPSSLRRAFFRRARRYCSSRLRREIAASPHLYCRFGSTSRTPGDPMDSPIWRGAVLNWPSIATAHHLIPILVTAVYALE